jgi:Tol biopolymer transport system component
MRDSLFVADMNGNVKFLSREAVAEPMWSPNGRYIVATGASVDNAVFEIDRFTGSSRVIASGYGWANHFSVKGSTLWNGIYYY